MERGRWKNKWKEPLCGTDKFSKISNILKAVHEECWHFSAVGTLEFCKVVLLRFWNLLKGVYKLSFWNFYVRFPSHLKRIE